MQPQEQGSEQHLVPFHPPEPASSAGRSATVLLQHHQSLRGSVVSEQLKTQLCLRDFCRLFVRKFSKFGLRA